MEPIQEAGKPPITPDRLETRITTQIDERRVALLAGRIELAERFVSVAESHMLADRIQ